MADGLVEALADCGGLAARLVEIHVSDGNGRCRVCRWHGRPNATFPCNLRSLATSALHLQATQAAGKVLPKQGAGPAF